MAGRIKMYVLRRVRTCADEYPKHCVTIGDARNYPDGARILS
jgi:hypothetical protein